MKEVWYVAHPVTGDPRGNAMRAVAWIKWLTHADPSRVYIAPWVAEVLAFADEVVSPEFYDRVLADDCEVVRRCDGVLLIGGAVSRGMTVERDAALAAGKAVLNWSGFESPDHVDRALWGRNFRDPFNPDECNVTEAQFCLRECRCEHPAETVAKMVPPPVESPNGQDPEGARAGETGPGTGGGAGGDPAPVGGGNSVVAPEDLPDIDYERPGDGS